MVRHGDRKHRQCRQTERREGGRTGHGGEGDGRGGGGEREKREREADATARYGRHACVEGSRRSAETGVRVSRAEASNCTLLRMCNASDGSVYVGSEMQTHRKRAEGPYRRALRLVGESVFVLALGEHWVSQLDSVREKYIYLNSVTWTMA